MGKFWNGYAWRDHIEPIPPSDRSDWGPSPLVPLIHGLRRIAKVNELVNAPLVVDHAPDARPQIIAIQQPQFAGSKRTVIEVEAVFSSTELLEDVRDGQRALNEAGKELFDKHHAEQRAGISVGRSCDVEEIDGKLVQTNLSEPKYDAVQRPINTRHIAITPRGLELGGFVGVSNPAMKHLVAMSDDRIAETNRSKMAELPLWPPPPHLDNTGADCRIDRDHDCCYTCNKAAGDE